MLVLYGCVGVSNKKLRCGFEDMLPSFVSISFNKTCILFIMNQYSKGRIWDRLVD